MTTDCRMRRAETLGVSRRDFLRLAALAAGSAFLSACGPLAERLTNRPSALGSLSPVDPEIFAVLNRLTYGPRPEELAHAAEIGIAGWIEEQLSPMGLDDTTADLQLTRLSMWSLDANALRDVSDRLFDDVDLDLVPAELRRATLLRQVFSRRQLYERVVEFWSDHFNISVEKQDCHVLKLIDERDVIRPHAFGRFRDLLGASAHSPAMLVYLDNHVSDAAHPNENYAREVMELHTLGVDGGYTQQDVAELARCLTGWSVVTEGRYWGRFQYKPEHHDNGEKRWLGEPIAAAGEAEVEHALDRLAAHPSTARFLVRKLAQRFLGFSHPELEARAATAFLAGEGQIEAPLRVLLLDGLAAGVSAPRFKRPVDFLVSTLRQLNATVGAGDGLWGALRRLGQLPFAWPTPDGYPDRDEAWSANLMPRWAFAWALGDQKLDSVAMDWNDICGSELDPGQGLDRLAILLFGAPLPDGDRNALLAELPGTGIEARRALAAALVASPRFQWR